MTCLEKIKSMTQEELAEWLIYNRGLNPVASAEEIGSSLSTIAARLSDWVKMGYSIIVL